VSKKSTLIIIAESIIIVVLIGFLLWRSGSNVSDESSTPSELLRYPKLGDAITPIDYSNNDYWLTRPDLAGQSHSAAKNDVDVFFVYPTSWRAEAGEYPIAEINNAEMRHWAEYYLTTRGSAFETAGTIYAPYYRQLDAAFGLSQASDMDRIEYFAGVPYTDIKASFEYYLENFNNGRPFILAGHSQGSAMCLLLLTDYLKDHPDVYKRMIAAYVIGIPMVQSIYDQYPHLRAAQSANDTGVIISYNTQAPVVDGVNPLSSPESVLINPISWRTDTDEIPASESKGSIIVSDDSTFVDAPQLADARIDPTRGVIICDVDREQFSSAAASRAYFPLGMFHENDIPLFYYDLRANAELRVQEYLAQQG
jgi:hypothetical protein